MAGQQVINIGSSPNDGTGDPIRTAFSKTNANEAALFGMFGPSSNLAATGNANAADIESLFSPAPVTVSGLGAVPRWIHVGNGLTFSAFAAAALTNSITLFSLPAAGIVHAIKIKHSTAFGGGSISAYSVSVGVTGNLAKLASAFNVFQAPGGTVLQLSANLDEENELAATNILATATAIGGNLNTAVSGAVDIWALLSIGL